MRKANAFPFLDEALGNRLLAAGVRLEDVNERFVRGSGPGGQKINKTSSTVWLRHEPSGLEVRCQKGRSQTSNRTQAWTELAQRVESTRQEALARAKSARELVRRQNRKLSIQEKKRRIESKRRQATRKGARGRIAGE